MGRNLTNLPISSSFQYLLQVSGSEVNDGLGNDVDSLTITASHATQADNASVAATAVIASTASYVAGANVDGSVASATSASFATNATSASFATTASFALNVTPIDTGSFMVTGSVVDATLTFTKADASTFDVVVNNVDNANTASLVSTADGTARSGIHYIPFIDVRTSSGQQLFADQQLQYNPATDTIEANLDGTASFATSASHAITADTASFLPSDTNLNINSISASSAVFQSASIGYLQTITGSAKIIGDAYIILNNDTPTERYAGLVVQDSGSGAPLTTASFEFDGQSNDWFYEYSDDGGVTTDHGIALFGPEYSTKGSPTYNANNKLVKGDGGHHLNDSNITDDGTLVTIDSNVSASGYISASLFIGDGSGLVNAGKLRETGSTYYTDDGTINTVNGVVIGKGSTTESDNAVAIGTVSISTTANRSVAIGSGSIVGAGADDTVAIGTGAESEGGDDVVSIGSSANGYNAAAVAVGQFTSADFCGVAIGASARAQGQNVVSIGRSCQSSALDSIGIGQRANRASGATGAAALGAFTDVDNAYGTALGYGAQATGSLAMEWRVNQAPLMSATTASQDVTFYGGASFENSVTGGVSALSITSTTASMDCSTGNFFALTLAAGVDTHLDATNLQAGQTINLKITNNAVTAGTISFSPDFEFEGGTAFTATAATSAVDVMTFISFDGASLQATGLQNFS